MTLQRSDIYTNIPKTTFREKSRFVLFGNQKRKQKSVFRIQLDLHHEQLFFNALMLITCLLPSAFMKSISRCRVLASARNPYSLAPHCCWPADARMGSRKVHALRIPHVNNYDTATSTPLRNSSLHSLSQNNMETFTTKKLYLPNRAFLAIIVLFENCLFMIW